jgi:short-subunit dehydrogenase
VRDSFLQVVVEAYRRRTGRAAVYTASKHFISNYMIGFRQKANRLAANITITDIRPGYVESEMTAHNKSMFWVSTTEKAVAQMVKAIEAKKNKVYVTKRWMLISWVARLTPYFVWNRLKF